MLTRSSSVLHGKTLIKLMYPYYSLVLWRCPNQQNFSQLYFESPSLYRQLESSLLMSPTSQNSSLQDFYFFLGRGATGVTFLLGTTGTTFLAGATGLLGTVFFSAVFSITFLVATIGWKPLVTVRRRKTATIESFIVMGVQRNWEEKDENEKLWVYWNED